MNTGLISVFCVHIIKKHSPLLNSFYQLQNTRLTLFRHINSPLAVPTYFAADLFLLMDSFALYCSNINPHLIFLLLSRKNFPTILKSGLLTLCILNSLVDQRLNLFSHSLHISCTFFLLQFIPQEWLL